MTPPSRPQHPLANDGQHPETIHEPGAPGLAVEGPGHGNDVICYHGTTTSSRPPSQMCSTTRALRSPSVICQAMTISFCPKGTAIRGLTTAAGSGSDDPLTISWPHVGAKKAAIKAAANINTVATRTAIASSDRHRYLLLLAVEPNMSRPHRPRSVPLPFC